MRPHAASFLLRASIAGALSVTLAACGGRIDTSEAPPPGPSVAPPSPASGTAFPSGTIAVGEALGGVTFYPRGASQGTAALGHLEWNVPWYVPQYLAFDAAGYLYVDSYDASDTAAAGTLARIDVFAPGSTGNAVPVRTIVGPHTQLWSARAMAIDAAGDLLVTNADFSSGVHGSIAVFAPGANGDAAPIRNVILDDIYAPCGLALDPNGSMFLADSEGGPVAEFSGDAQGETVPTRVFSGTTAIMDATGVALGANGVIYVADVEGNDVIILAPGSNGQIVQTILGGAATQISTPSDLALDRDGRLLVAAGENGLLIFDPRANGNAAPLGALSADPLTPVGYNVAIAP
ncbi:MAG TPA: hypothetical protein VGI39_33870 [Polyangiaceae bacterium]|jgi:hypothetical protein